jgi:murein DD-endopeptidase MepM/ murein hydrolase activator NlpD
MPVELQSADRRTRWVAVVVALTILVGLVGLPAADADDPGTQDERSQRDDVRAKQAQVASDLDAMKASDAQLEAAVATLDENLAAQEAKVDDATRNAEQARATADAMAAQVTRSEAHVTKIRGRVKERALRDYVTPDDDDAALFLHAASPNDAEARRALNGLVSGSDADVLNQLRAAREDAQRARDRADRAEAAADQRRSELEQEQADLRTARDEQAAAAQALEGRISEYQQEAAALSAQEDSLTGLIRQKEAEAAARAEAARQAEAARKAEADRQAAAAKAEADRAAAIKAAQDAAANTTTAPAPGAPPATAAPTTSAPPPPATAPPETAPPPSNPGSGLIWPADGPVTSGFGYRWGALHPGIDIGAPYGAPIHAAKGGTVIYAGWMDGYGNFVLIDHGGGFVTGYGHQSQIAVSEGQQVSQGQVIGYVGSTGNSTGPHLHFETRVNGAVVDPMIYL